MEPEPSSCTRNAWPGALLAQIHALEDLLLGAGGQARHGVVFVQQGDVVVHVLLLFHHALQACVQDHADLMRKRRVVADAVGNGARQDVAVAVLVLQALAIERGAPGRAARMKPRACMSPAAQAKSPKRWKPNIE